MRAGLAPETEDSVRAHRSAATAGILYIIGTVAGVLSFVVLAPVRDAGDPLAAGAQHHGSVVTGALAVQEMVLAVWMIAKGFNLEPKLPASKSRA